MTVLSLLFTTEIIIRRMATEIPTIEHPQDCSCSYCAQSSSYGYISRRRSYQNVQTNAQAGVSWEEVVFKPCLYFAISLLIFGVYSFFFSGHTTAQEVGVSVYYQDLNVVEIRQYPGNEISPELIRQIHHFQKRPFGLPNSVFSDMWCSDTTKFVISVICFLLLFLMMRLC